MEVFGVRASAGASGRIPSTQRLQYSLIKGYTLNHIRHPVII